MTIKTIFFFTLAFSLPLCSLVIANQTDSTDAHKSFEKMRFLPQNYGSKIKGDPQARVIGSGLTILHPR